MAVVSILLLFPASAAYAGILSFVGEIFGSLSFSQDMLTAPVNSQTMDLLEAVRNYDPSPEPDGTEVRIVNDSALAASLTPAQSGDASARSFSSDQISVYVVRPGDTLSQIANMFGVSVNTILWSNDIPRGGSIKVGQKLVVLPVSGLRYTIKKGDTVAKIAALHKADAEEIYSFNDINESGALTVGDTIIIPNGVETPPPPTASNKKTSVSVSLGISSTVTNGYFARPARGVRTQGIHGHNGVDFSGRGGSEVFAAAAGTVIVSKDSGWNGGYGQYIVIKHSNGTQTLYAHLSENMVSEGAEVSRGQRIGTIGATGKSYGPHLHFEVRGGRNPF